MEGSANAFERSYLDEGRECFIETNIDTRSKSLFYNNQELNFYQFSSFVTKIASKTIVGFVDTNPRAIFSNLPMIV